MSDKDKAICDRCCQKFDLDEGKDTSSGWLCDECWTIEDEEEDEDE